MDEEFYMCSSILMTTLQDKYHLYPIVQMRKGVRERLSQALGLQSPGAHPCPVLPLMPKLPWGPGTHRWWHCYGLGDAHTSPGAPLMVFLKRDKMGYFSPDSALVPEELQAWLRVFCRWVSPDPLRDPASQGHPVCAVPHPEQGTGNVAWPLTAGRDIKDTVNRCWSVGPRPSAVSWGGAQTHSRRPMGSQGLAVWPSLPY